MRTNKVSYRPIYNRRKQLDREGKAGVVIEAYQNGKRRYFKTGIHLKPNEWDERRKEVKKSPGLNRVLNECIDELQEFEINFSAQHKRAFKLDDFDLMESKTPAEPEPIVTFTSFALQHIERDKASGTLNRVTFGRHNRVIKLLSEFSGKKAVEFTDINYSFIDRFNHYLLTVNKINLNTTHKHHQILQKYLTIAIKKGLFELKDNPYNDFKARKTVVESTVLLPAEIEKIEQLTFTEVNQHLEVYRDAFLLGYYTLLRIGDVTRLRTQDIISTSEGLVLQLKAQKTGKFNQLPLYNLHKNGEGPSKPERIIQKYMRTDKKPLFSRSHPRLNIYVKQVARLAGINKKVTFHTSRHSGITYLSTKLPTPLVQQLAQHSSIATTMGYIHISRQQVEASLTQVDWS
jgi:integrase